MYLVFTAFLFASENLEKFDNELNIIADNYTSIAAKTNAKELDIAVKEDVNISSQKLSGEQKFGKDGSNFNAYAFESNIGSNVNAEDINIDAKNLNITGSAVLAKEAVLDVDKVNIDSNVDKVDTESRSKSKGFLSSKSKVEMQHNETNVAGTLYVEDKATINGDVNVVGSNLVLGKDSYVDGSLTTDSKATYNKYILEEKKKGFSFDLSSSSFNLSYGKNQFNYDEKDKTNIKSNLVLGDGTVLNKGAEITATNFSHGDIEVNNGDVVYGARKDERDVKISTKSSSFGISANVSSPALERIKQGANALEQIGNGDALGGLVNIGNAVTGTVDGLASNIKTKDGKQATAEDIKDNKFTSNNSFYMQAGVSAGYSKSKQESKSHNEKAVVTNITGLDENAKITYNDNKNVKYQGTQASDTTFVYNNVENITKEAVETNNYYKTKGNSFGVGVSAGISGSNEVSVSVNASASVNKLNSEQTIYENGKFTNVNEVHNNTGTMKLSGFNQEGGTVTGSIKKLEIESLQNTSKTDGYTAGGNISVGITNAGAVSGNVHGSLTDGDRAFVDNQSTFVVGENSNLKIGNVDNTASIIGTTDNGKISIENYTGINLENSDKLTTVGGSVGTSGVGINYSNSEKEGITRNTVVGNIEIEKSSGDTINRDLSKANEITKDSSTSTNVYAESQLVNAVQNPNEFKEKAEVAKIEINSLGNSISKSIDNILNGDKSQDISKAERRQLEEIKEAVIRVQTAKEIETIATKDLTDPKIQAELGVEIEKFDTNSPNLSEAVKTRIEELAKNGEGIVAFYDKSTGKIFINENAPEDKVRPAVAREWKIREDLIDGKGKLNTEGKERATVVGEIAYDEVLGRISKEKPDPIDMSKLNSATMNPDSEVSADLITEKDREKRNNHYNTLKNDKAYTTTTDILVDFTPAGTLKDIYEIVKGEKFLSEEKIDPLERLSLITSFTKGISHINDIRKTFKIKEEKLVEEKVLKNISDKKINKELHEKINSREKEHFLNLQADKNVEKITAPIDFDRHIINGEINNRGNAVGGHSTLGNVRIDNYLGTTYNGIRKGEVSIFDSKTNQWIKKIDRQGKVIENTLYPEWWSENRIKVENDAAYWEWRVNNPSINTGSWEGETPSGIKVKGYLTPNTTVYPKKVQ